MKKYAVKEVYFDGFEWFGFFSTIKEARRHAAEFIKKDYGDSCSIFKKVGTGYERIDFD